MFNEKTIQVIKKIISSKTTKIFLLILVLADLGINSIKVFGAYKNSLRVQGANIAMNNVIKELSEKGSIPIKIAGKDGKPEDVLLVLEKKQEKKDKAEKDSKDLFKTKQLRNKN